MGPPMVTELDLGRALRGEASTQELESLALALREALSTLGFVTLRGALGPSLAAELRELSAQLFALSLTDKRALAMRHAGPAWRGWFALGDEFTAGARDQKEGFYLGVEHGEAHPEVRLGSPMHGRNLWPSKPALARLPVVVAAWMAAMRRVAELLMSLVARGLELEPEYFAQRFGHEPTELFRIFRYPSQAAGGDAGWGVGEHTDMGFLTLLLTDGRAGLEVAALDGEWIALTPGPEQLVVNVGDMLEVWTRGLYRATPHRVRQPVDGARMSWPYFFDPGWRVVLDPIDPQRLPPVPTRTQGRRWDGLELAQLPTGTTYGEFVWAKISKVFPELAAGVHAEERA